MVFWVATSFISAFKGSTGEEKAMSVITKQEHMAEGVERIKRDCVEVYTCAVNLFQEFVWGKAGVSGEEDESCAVEEKVQGDIQDGGDAYSMEEEVNGRFKEAGAGELVKSLNKKDVFPVFKESLGGFFPVFKENSDKFFQFFENSGRAGGSAGSSPKQSKADHY